MFQQQYGKMMNQVTPSSGFLERLIAVPQVKRKKQKRPVFRVVVRIGVLICSVVAGISVLAATNEEFNQMLYSVSPGVAQFFKPIQMSCEDNGILVTVESASIQGDMAQAYLSVRDVTGDRVDDTTDFYDSAVIRTGSDLTVNCQQVGFEQETATAMFLLTCTQWGEKPIAGEKVTFQASCFLSQQKTYEQLEIPIDWSKAVENTSAQQVELHGRSGFFADPSIVKDSKVLCPGIPQAIGIEGISLSAVGFVEGRLHLQTVVENSNQNDNHGYFSLKSRQGKVVEAIGDLSYNVKKENGTTLRYCDGVFEVTPEELEEYSLLGTFWTSGNYTEGDWEVTFPLEMAAVE